jgi:hypothetical protein
VNADQARFKYLAGARLRLGTLAARDGCVRGSISGLSRTERARGQARPDCFVVDYVNRERLFESESPRVSDHHRTHTHTHTR